MLFNESVREAHEDLFFGNGVDLSRLRFGDAIRSVAGARGDGLDPHAVPLTQKEELRTLMSHALESETSIKQRASEVSPRSAGETGALRLRESGDQPEGSRWAKETL